MGAKIDKIQAEITLNDNGFLDAINRVEKRTNTYRKAANDAKGGNEALAQSFRSTAQGIAVFDGPLGGVASRFSSLGSLVSSTSLGVVAFGAAISAAAIGAGVAVRAGQSMEQQLYKQEAVLRATGYAAGWNAEQLDSMARQTAYATLASVNDIREAQNVMMTFRRVQKSVFVDAVGLSQDLAVVLGGTVTSNAKMLGKALENPIEGIWSLTRAGVTFTTSQREMVREMVNTGNAADAQRYILSELKNQVGGTGAGEAAGLSGSIDTLGQNFQTLFENINQATGAGKGFKFMVDALAFTSRDISDALAPSSDPVSQQLAELFDKRLEALRQADNSQNEYMRNQFLAEAEDLNVQMKALSKIRNEAAQKGVKDYEKGIETRRALEQEAADDLRRAREAAGAKSLTAIDSAMASEEQKIEDRYVKQLGQIQALTLSEEEVKRRGYVNLAALRLDYQLRLEDQYTGELDALNAKLIAEQVAKDDAARRDQEREERAAERAEAARQRQIDSSRDYFQSIDDQYNQAFLSAADNEDLRFQKTQERMAKERQLLIDQNTWTAQNQTSYEKTSQNAKRVHEKNLTDIQEAEQQARLNAQRDFANIFVGMADSQNKTLAAIGKAAAIYNIGIATYEGAMSAYKALAPIPFVGPFLGIAAAGAVVAYGAEQIAGVRSQKYHTGGIAGEAADNYGAKLKSGEINATLMRGEEVLTADDPRHRNNLGTVYESGSLASSSSNVLNVGGISIYVEGGQFENEQALAESLAQQMNQKLDLFMNSSAFKSAAVGAVSTYAKRNSGRIPGVRT